jgi:pseudouridine-5'-phosphate glycosidase
MATGENAGGGTSARVWGTGALSGARGAVALETTLLLHGVPRESAMGLHTRLTHVVHEHGAVAQLVGVIGGRPVVGMSDAQLQDLLNLPTKIPKLNTSNLGAALARGEHGATTVSSTMELAAGAGVSVFATGGIGGVHFPPKSANGASRAMDISADLYAFTRFPVAVVTSGVKSILDIAATREMLETIGVPVVGFGTSDFPAFYRRSSEQPGVGPVDARFDDIGSLATFVRRELARTGRGIVVCNPIPVVDEIPLDRWNAWLCAAEAKVEAGGGALGRDATPRLLGALHEVSEGGTLKANIALVENNAKVAAQLARAMCNV